MRNFFNGLAREDLPGRVPSVNPGNTVATSQGYPSLPSDDSESEGEMEGPSHPGLDGMAEIRKEGKKQGRKEGRKEGTKEGRKEGKERGREIK